MFYSRGGKPINSGGYGCVFKPALKCQGDQKRNDGISKLMTQEHAESEYQIIMRFADKIRQIPDYQKYFVLDGISLCTPSKLTKDDLTSYNSVCGSLTKKGFGAREVNSKLDELGILNLPDAGIDLDEYITSAQWITPKLIENINQNISRLLNNAIVPMNKLNILHMDMKGSNVMVDTKDNLFKIIDWGLADIYDGISVPLVATNRPIQYNTPFSSILFNDSFQTIYEEFIANTPNVLDATPEKEEMLNTFVVNYYSYWTNSRGMGHHDYIHSIIRYIASSKLNGFVSDNEFKNLISYYFYTFLVSYISPILRKYTKNGKFQDDIYFKEVYSKNVDVWGLLMSYEILLPIIHGTRSELTEPQKKTTYAFVVDLITTFLYSNPTEPIDISSVSLYISNFTKYLTGRTITPVPKKTTGTVKSRTMKKPTLKLPSSVMPKSHKKSSSRKATLAKRSVKSVVIDAPIQNRSKSPIKVVKHTAKRRRCPNGTHWNKQQEKCTPKHEKHKKKNIIRKVFGYETQETPIALVVTEKHKRCPSGTRKNKKTGKCEPKTIMQIKTKRPGNKTLKKEHLPIGIREILQN
ncbi:MAG: hypothetical protein ACXABD_00160 [Candidatus Thorarchaeota archaeon]|jgi:serine/threonine protein kinase